MKLTGATAQGSANQAVPNEYQVLVNLNAGGGLIPIDECVRHTAITQALDITVEALGAALDAGKTPAALALALGVGDAAVDAVIDAGHDATMPQVIASGLTISEQADWRFSHQGGPHGQQENGVCSGYDGKGPDRAP